MVIPPTRTAKINPKVLAMRSSISTVVTLLSRNKIPVTTTGTGAYVQSDKNGNPVAVNLPFIPDDATDEMLLAMRGYLDHEVAHILFTCFKTRLNVPNKLDHLWNVIEDIYIERKMSEHLKGCGFNLSKTRKHVIESSFEPHFVNALASGASSNPKKLFIEVLCVPAMRALCGQTEFIDWMNKGNKWQTIEPITKQIITNKLPNLINNIEHTSQSIDAAIILAKLLISDDEEKPPLKSDEDSDKGDDSGKDDSNSDDSPTSDSDNDPDNGNSSDDSENESDPEPEDEEQGEYGDGDGDGDRDDDAEEDNNNENNEDDNNNENNDTDGDKDDSPLDSDTANEDEQNDSTYDPTTSSDKKDDSELDSDGMPDFDKLDEYKAPISIEAALSETISAGSHAKTYRPLSTDLDWMGCVSQYPKAAPRILAIVNNSPLTVQKGWEENFKNTYARGTEFFTSILEPIFLKSSAMSKEIERLILGQNKVQWRGGKRSGAVHGANLFKLKVGDNRVFRTKDVHNSKNAAVLIVNDLSGSMSCRSDATKPERVHQALASSYMIADALEKCRIPTMVTGFTTLGRDNRNAILRRLAERGEMSKEIEQSVNDACCNPCREEPLIHPIIKDWDASCKSRTVIQNFGFTASHQLSLQNNVDGESLLAFLPLLQARTEEVKLMIVLSDGEPYAVGKDHVPHLKTVTDFIERKTDIHLVGVGIETDTKLFYKNNCRIDDIDQLPAMICSEIRKTLLG